MTAKRAREIAAAWVTDAAKGMNGLRGVFFGGSLTSMDDATELAELSDVDLFFVVDDAVLSTYKQHKLEHDGVLMDVSYHPSSALRTAEDVLADFLYAHHLSRASILFDPTGEMRQTHAAVARGYHELRWVQARCDRIARRIIEQHIPQITAEAPLYDRIWGLLWTINHMVQLLLAALLRAPTIRKGLMFFRDWCVAQGAAALYDSYARLMGTEMLTASGLTEYLGLCAAAYDYAVPIRRTPFAIDFHVSAGSRPFAIDGAADLLRKGYRREAAVWILFAWTIANEAIQNDGEPGAAREFGLRHSEYLGALGLGGAAELARRSEEARIALARCREVADSLIAANPEIIRSARGESRPA